MSDARGTLLQILDQIELAKTEMLNAKAWSAGEECRKHCKFALTSLDVAHKMVDELQSGLRSGEKLGIVRTDADFDFDRNSQTHTPKLTLYFEPVHVQAPYDAKGWNDRDTAAAMLAAPERKL